MSVVSLVAGAAVAMAAPGARAATDPGSTSGYLQGASHNAVAPAGFAGALHQVWNRPLPGAASYAVADAGRVFTVADGWVYALSAANGAVLWGVDIASTTSADLVTSDGILLVAARADGALVALDEATGLRRWALRTTPGLYTFRFTTALAPGNGVVYVGTYSPAGVQARRITDGALLWQQPTAGYPVAADATAVYVSTVGCGFAAYALIDGTARWQRPGTCGTAPTGPSDGTATVAGSNVYEPSGQILGTSSGKPIASYTSQYAPVRAGGVVLLERRGTLAAMAVDAPDGAPIWTFDGDPGAPDVTGQVVVAGRQVFVRTSARSLYTLDIASGRPSGPPLTLLSASAAPQQGVRDAAAVGDGLLLVPNGPNMTAFAATPYRGPVPAAPAPITVHPSAPAPANDATAYLQNGARDGVNGSAALTGPLVQAWATRFHGTVSYPLLVAGRVYVTVHTGSTEDLYALAQKDGRLLWRVGLPYFSGVGSQAVYDGGSVFVLTNLGQLVRVRAKDGTVVYRERVPTGGLPGNGWATPPSAYGGVLYLVGDGAGSGLYLIRESDGALLHGERSNSGRGALGLYQGAVYQDAACAAEAFRSTDGAPVWGNGMGCSGPGFFAATVHAHNVFDVDDGLVNRRLNAATGALIGTFTASSEPTFAGSLLILLNHGTLTGEDPVTGRLVWQQSRGFVLPPAAVGNTVLDVDAAGRTWALDGLTGAVSSVSAPGAPPLHELNSSVAATGIATAADIVAVPEGTLLVAFRPR